MPRALLSVHDKTGLVELGKGLADLGWDLVASGGTAHALSEAGLFVTSVDQVTKHPEMLGGRVKTLHPAIHGGILARDTDDDLKALSEQGYAPIALVVCNLYPFQETVARPNVTLEEAVEQIDIGGVTLLRAAAKNFARVTVLCDPADYVAALAQLRTKGAIDADTRQRLAVKAFEHTRNYDTAIHAYLSDQIGQFATNSVDDLPASLSIGVSRIGELRYGENPHQHGALYATRTTAGPLGGTLLGGKALSYNNLLDLDAAWRAAEQFPQPTVVIVKHLNPCGIATGRDIASVFPAALACDPVSAYGGVIAVNRCVDEAFVAAMGDLFVEAIAAPDFTRGAQETLIEKRKNCRLLRLASETNPKHYEFRSIRGGVLVQTIDQGDPADAAWRVVSKRAPTTDELAALRFAWQACQFVKSNAIVLATALATVGIGGGLSSRVDSARLAVEKAGERAKGSVMASDAFFPFPDALEVGIAAGVTAVVSPGGSIRDEQAIAAADAAGVTMVFTGVRHFRH
ncbi:MAG: bifunctional phosphoribosylaminoimidazolecarboxamide formyltransferase/IMP cyclohydrolase [Anaerolineae bacterium]|nr:bifunctional phosphoribosylaminoimidazolecarboxamide formyltransferase/IMP cyclohydrolase [Anaerolineae bacterium]